MKIHCFGYPISFHHLPLVFWELFEFPSCGLRSVKADVFQDEVSKMLEKGTLELVDWPGQGFL